VDDRRECEYILIRYVPDPVKAEFVNIGVVLTDSSEGGRTEVRFTRDWARVRCMDADADVGTLELLERDIRLSLAQNLNKPIMEIIADSFSNVVQATEARGYLAESLPAGMEQLMRLHVESEKRQRTTRRAGRQAIQHAMRTQFERAGVWDLMRKRIAAAAYTRAGDPLRIDCGYRPNGMVRMFHAVSLEGDLELAKVLAFTAPALRAGVARVENAALELTAIVEPLRAVAGEDEERVAEYRFAVETMEEREIRVLTVPDLPRVAEAAQRELRV
jgi:hypothetical protein